MKKILLSLILLGFCFSVDAQSVVKAVKNSDGTFSIVVGVNTYRRLKAPFHNEHEFRFGLGAYPYDITMGYKYDSFSPPGLNESIDKIGFYKAPKYGIPALNIAYSYRFERWFEVGVNLTYKTTYLQYKSTYDDSNIGSSNEYMVSLAPVIRLSWLNREYVRLYSSVSLGMLYYNEVDNNPISGDTNTDGGIGVTGQLTLFGISVGKKFFGYAEAMTFGTQGMIIGGFGYRFLDKK